MVLDHSSHSAPSTPNASPRAGRAALKTFRKSVGGAGRAVGSTVGSTVGVVGSTVGTVGHTVGTTALKAGTTVGSGATKVVGAVGTTAIKAGTTVGTTALKAGTTVGTGATKVVGAVGTGAAKTIVTVGKTGNYVRSSIVQTADHVLDSVGDALVGRRSSAIDPDMEAIRLMNEEYDPSSGAFLMEGMDDMSDTSPVKPAVAWSYRAFDEVKDDFSSDDESKAAKQKILAKRISAPPTLAAIDGSGHSRASSTLTSPRKTRVGKRRPSAASAMGTAKEGETTPKPKKGGKMKRSNSLPGTLDSLFETEKSPLKGKKKKKKVVNGGDAGTVATAPTKLTKKKKLKKKGEDGVGYSSDGNHASPPGTKKKTPLRKKKKAAGAAGISQSAHVSSVALEATSPARLSNSAHARSAARDNASAQIDPPPMSDDEASKQQQKEAPAAIMSSSAPSVDASVPNDPDAIESENTSREPTDPTTEESTVNPNNETTVPTPPAASDQTEVVQNGDNSAKEEAPPTESKETPVVQQHLQTTTSQEAPKTESNNETQNTKGESVEDPAPKPNVFKLPAEKRNKLMALMKMKLAEKKAAKAAGAVDAPSSTADAPMDDSIENSAHIGLDPKPTTESHATVENGDSTPDSGRVQGANDSVTDNGDEAQSSATAKFALRNIRRFTNSTDSKWNAMRASAHFIARTKKSAEFAKLFEEEAPSGEARPMKKSEVKAAAVASVKKASAEVDRRLAGVEELEQALAAEKKTLNMQREKIAFERESLELQLQEEINRNEALELQVAELQSKLEEAIALNESEGGQDPDGLAGENEALRSQLNSQQREAEQRMNVMEAEMGELKETIKALRMEHDVDDIAVNPNDGKSRQRLQGELLLAVTTLRTRDEQIDRARDEIISLTQELSGFRSGKGVVELREEIEKLKGEIVNGEEALEKEKRETEMKLKSKDETIAFLIEELGQVKKAQSEAKGGMLGSFAAPNILAKKEEEPQGIPNLELDFDSILSFAGFGKSTS
eukprot:Nitzschia sp. Nitz4//scaffold24_size164493//126569//129607//NITZ4_002346-RA/size164493-processed-gene-0.242-mRNA-1//-1//CDS//3329544168//8021//frame0